ncbi:TetR/AcrR family transcriptional regulator [Photobacterium sp. OFAV2-7]|uniref:TetR/AcrR family transcriptional regulator n=1 Tax=Photobacterium sp. OFAV2-7 TaxID=2917748 RepID=UPI001EF65344|nr:TetR/AcrR family transcriptional regulator [Photobacterium sp. OFAV2-7]MCG7587598.1 TetR/AcrR family transcriptional regulator [Photobacterium sp. OFAV2-7]
MPVKEKKRGRPKGSGSQLSKEAIMDMAKSLMQEDGKIPSIRKLAASLSVDAMAIYHYFSNKNALLEAITTSLIEDIYEPKMSDNWKSELNKLCTSYLTLLSRYPGLLEILLGMDSHSPAEVFIERFSVVVKPLNLNADSSKNALELLVDYLHGYALALQCNSGQTTLEISMIEGPLGLYCVALENA